MKSLSSLREAIIRAHDRGKTVMEIADFLGISHSTVSKAIKRFEETGSNEDRPGRGRKKSARSKENILRAKGMNKRNPTTKANSARKLGKKLGVDKMSAWRILRKDLELFIYKYQKRQRWWSFRINLVVYCLFCCCCYVLNKILYNSYHINIRF